MLSPVSVSSKTYQQLPEYTSEQNALWHELTNECFENIRTLAHPKCAEGIRKLGFVSQRIPSVIEIGSRLAAFGWGATPVTGLIAPRTFFGYLSQKILPIATNMRERCFKEYSPDPDVFHEAFGHACLLTDPFYSKCLQRFGEISLKAFQFPADKEYYSSVTKLAKFKTLNHGTVENKAIAAKTVNLVSEATLLARLGWWSFECGFVLDDDQPKAYGAALLSSTKEILQATNNPRLMGLNESCVEFDYDPTELQPHYFIAPSFEYLSRLLDSLASKMAFQIGGADALDIAIVSEEDATLVFDSGIELSGQVVAYTKVNGKILNINFKNASSYSLIGDQKLVSVYPAINENEVVWN
ncbi:MAG: hypothetical protein R3A80_07690 [Bdellovibrionota bacterium]